MNIDLNTTETKKAVPVVPKPGLLSLVLRQVPYLALVAAILAVPMFLFKPNGQGTNYGLTVLVYVGINVILAVGLNLLMGYAGQVSLGHAAFYGIGAYVSAILTVQFNQEISYQPVPVEIMPAIAVGIAIMAAAAAVIALLKLEAARLGLAVAGFATAAILLLRTGAKCPVSYIVAIIAVLLTWAIFKVSISKLLVSYTLGAAAGVATHLFLNHAVAAGGITPWWAMFAGVVFTSLVAYLIGVQSLRLHGHYLAMATMGFGIIVTIVFREWGALTGGTSGISGLPALTIMKKPIETDLSMYYLVWAVVAIVIVLASNIVNSRVGRAFRAVHGSEIAASSVGVDASRYKVEVFVLSAALASIAGSLYAHSTTRFVAPESFGIMVSVQLVVMVVVGGMASVWGAILGAGAITALGEWLRYLNGDDSSRIVQIVHKVMGPEFVISDLEMVIFASILILIMIYLPQGLVRGVVDSAKMAVRLARRKSAG